MEARVMPYSLQAEQSVLGSILINKDLMLVIADLLQPEDFYKESHLEVYTAMGVLYQKREIIDLVTVVEELKKKDVLERCGGIPYITALTSAPDFTDHILSYATIVKEKSILRRLIRASADTMAKSYAQGEEVDEILNFAEKSIFDISQDQVHRGLIPIQSIIMESFEVLQQLSANKGSITGLTSGFLDLDRKTNGFQKTDLVLVAARPAMGKTAFALNLAQNAAIRQDASVAVFTLEMSKEQLIQRMIAGIAQVELNNLKTGNISEGDWEKIVNAMGVLSSKKIHVDDSPGITALELRSKCRRLKMDQGLDLVVIDYLQLMESDARVENRQQEISKISRALKILAKELACPVIALSQLSRGPESRSDHRPMLSDLRESGAIEQDADIVMFLYRDDYYNKESTEKNTTEVILAKHRHGEVGTVKLTWLGQYQLFLNMANLPGS